MAIARILIVRLGSMGDVIHALPAAAALRALFPQARIGWAIEEHWAELLCSRPRDLSAPRPRSPEEPLVDQIHIIDTRGWRIRPFCGGTRREVLAAMRELRQTNYDVAIDFQGAWKSGVIALASRAPVRIGFDAPRERAARLFYTRRVRGQGEHIVEQNVSLLAALVPLAGDGPATVREIALPQPPPAPELPGDEAQERWADEELARHGWTQRGFAIINPGAGWAAKCWPAENYAEVARGLAESGIPSIVNFGPGEEALARAVETASRGAAVAGGRYSLSELIALTRRARLFVGGDTGPMHLAAALHVPVVAIFGPTDPARNGPYATEAVVLRSPESVTNHSRRAPRDTAMLAIAPAAVLGAARQLLERTV